MRDEDKFNNEIAARSALHEMLLEKVFAQWIAATRNPDETMARLLESLQVSMQNLSPPSGQALAPEQQEFIAYQRDRVAQLAENFVRKVSNLVRKE